MKISSIFVAFLENRNFNSLNYPIESKVRKIRSKIVGTKFLIMYHCFDYSHTYHVKLMFSKKATKIDNIFTVDLTLCSKCQIDGKDFIIFCGLLRKHEL